MNDTSRLAVRTLRDYKENLVLRDILTRRLAALRQSPFAGAIFPSDIISALAGRRQERKSYNNNINTDAGFCGGRGAKEEIGSLKLRREEVKERIKSVERSLMCLSAEEREVVGAFYLGEGGTTEEVADRLHMSVTKVKYLKKRATDRLARLLAV